MRRLRDRWGEHIRGIKRGDASHPLYQHFKEKHGSKIEDVKYMIGLKKVEGNWRTQNIKSDLARKEMELIYTFNTLKPGGLNIMLN